MNNALPTVSIVIVTLNAGKTLQKALESIYEQRYPALQIVLIDGGSSDNTLDIVKANQSKIFYWESKPDKGVYDAMNKAIKQATGDWIYFLGADDELYDDFSRLAYALEDPNAIYYANVRTDGELRSGEMNALKFAKEGVFHQAMIYPAKVFKKYLFDQRYRINADYALNLACWGDKKIKYTYKPLVIAHFNHTGLSGTVKDLVFEKDKDAIVFKNFSLGVWLRYKFDQYTEARERRKQLHKANKDNR